MKLRENRIDVINNKERPARKIISAILSYNSLFPILSRIERKERIQLAINNMMDKSVISSIIVFAEIFKIFNEVSTMKQIPRRLEDAFKI